MEKKYEDYLGLLPLTKVKKERVEQVIELNLKIKEMDILDIFICEMKDKEGARIYTSLWLFTDKYCIECKDFLTTIDFDIVSYKNVIQYCSISTNEFDFETTSENSSIKIVISTSNIASGTLIATGDNCLKAFDIYKKYFVSNLNT